MTSKEHFKTTFLLAWPVMLGQLGHVSVGLADSIMIGQLGTIPLAASAFANSIFVVPLVFGIGMAYGMTTPIAQADGQNKPDKAGSYLRHGLLINILAALLIFILVLIFSLFIGKMGQEAEVVALADPYLLIITGSIFPFMLYLSFKQFAEGLSDTRMAMIISLGANVVNVILNYLLIYGKWGLPELGLNGAGYATLFSRVLMAVGMYFYVFKAKRFIPYLKHSFKMKWQKSRFKEILEIGIPSGAQYIFEVSAFAVAAIIVGQISAESLAAHQIAISLAALSYMMASGLGAAATVRVANQLGKKDYQTMLAAGRMCFKMILGLMTLWGLAFFIGRNFLPSLYTSEITVMAIAAQLLVVAVFFQLSDGAQVVALGALRGMSDVKIPTLISFIAYWLFGLLPAYILGIIFEMGAIGVWYGLALGLTTASILLYWRFEWKSKNYIDAKE